MLGFSLSIRRMRTNYGHISVCHPRLPVRYTILGRFLACIPTILSSACGKRPSHATNVLMRSVIVTLQLLACEQTLSRKRTIFRTRTIVRSQLGISPARSRQAFKLGYPNLPSSSLIPIRPTVHSKMLAWALDGTTSRVSCIKDEIFPQHCTTK